MDISKWPMDYIMQLPDHLLSRRFLVSVMLDVVENDSAWDISELALPDRAIVHEFYIWVTGAFNKIAQMRLALGDQLPTSTAMMDALEPLFSGFGAQGPSPRQIPISTVGQFRLSRLRMYVPAQGRRLILECISGEAIILGIHAGVVVSAIPREIPDCLLLA